jgi:hypothetical protein
MDACVLYDAPVRDLLLRLGSAGLLVPVWSARILDECFRAIATNRADLAPDQLRGLRAALERAFPKASVAAPLTRVEVALPDSCDVHVVETAVAAGAPVILTYNLRDFPDEALGALGVLARHPDVVVRELIDIDPGRVARLVTEQAAALRRPPLTVTRLLATLEVHGLRMSVERLRPLLDAPRSE